MNASGYGIRDARCFKWAVRVRVIFVALFQSLDMFVCRVFLGAEAEAERRRRNRLGMASHHPSSITLRAFGPWDWRIGAFVVSACNYQSLPIITNNSHKKKILWVPYKYRKCSVFMWLATLLRVTDPRSESQTSTGTDFGAFVVNR
jgi:hypothetical protein